MKIAASYGFSIFVSATLTCRIILLDGSTGEATWIDRLYRRYSITMAGSLIGLVWTCWDSLIIAARFTWLYYLGFSRLLIRTT